MDKALRVRDTECFGDNNNNSNDINNNNDRTLFIHRQTVYTHYGETNTYRHK